MTQYREDGLIKYHVEIGERDGDFNCPLYGINVWATDDIDAQDQATKMMDAEDEYIHSITEVNYP